MFISTSIRSAERNYYSSNNFIKDYGDKHGLHAEITNKTASFAQCSLLKYSVDFRITTNSDSILVFDAQNITDMNRKTGFVDNLKDVLDSQFETRQNLDVHGLAYLVQKGSYELNTKSGEPFVISITDSKKLTSIETLSWKDVYATILQDDMTYQQFIDKVQNTKNNTCQGTPRKYGSYWFANEHIVIGDVSGLSQDQTHSQLYLHTSPKKHIATITTRLKSHEPMSSDDLKHYETIINRYTGQEIPIYTNGDIAIRTNHSGTKVFRVIEGDAIFPEPLQFGNTKVFFENIKRSDIISLLDDVKQIIENAEPSFYDKIVF